MPLWPYFWNLNGDRIAAPVFRSVRRLPRRQRLAVVLVEHRLGVERVDLRRPAVHEQVDDVLRLRREVRLLRRERVERRRRRGERRVVGEHAGEAEHAEAGAAAGEHVAAGKSDSIGIAALRQSTNANSLVISSAVGEVDPAVGRGLSPRTPAPARVPSVGRLAAVAAVR